MTRTRWPPDPAAVSSRPTSSTVVRDDPAVRLLYARAAHTRLEIARALGLSASMMSTDSRDSASARAHGMLARRVKSKPRAEISHHSSHVRLIPRIRFVLHKVTLIEARYGVPTAGLWRYRMVFVREVVDRAHVLAPRSLCHIGTLRISVPCFLSVSPLTSQLTTLPLGAGRDRRMIAIASRRSSRAPRGDD